MTDIKAKAARSVTPCLKISKILH